MEYNIAETLERSIFKAIIPIDKKRLILLPTPFGEDSIGLENYFEKRLIWFIPSLFFLIL